MQVVGKTMVKAPMKRPNRIQENDWGAGELNEFIKLSSEFGLGFAVSLVFRCCFRGRLGGGSAGCRACFWSAKGWHPLGLGLIVSRMWTAVPFQDAPKNASSAAGK